MCQPYSDVVADAIERGRRSRPDLFPNGWLNPSTTLGPIDFDSMLLEPFNCMSRVKRIIDVVRNYNPAATGDVTFTADSVVETVSKRAFANLPAICVMEPSGNLVEL